MKNIFLAIFVLSTIVGFSQVGQKNFIDQNYIEVVGSAKREVIPDKIYLSVQINEEDNRGKVSLEELESNMLQKLQELGLDLEKQVTIKDLGSNFQFYLLLKTNVYTNKSYEILVYDGEMAGKVIVELAKQDISNVSVSKLEHSNIENITLEVKQEAVKNAQIKAESLVSTLDQRIGRAIHIQEFDDPEDLYDALQGKVAGVRIRGYAASAAALPSINFESITIDSRILVKFILE